MFVWQLEEAFVRRMFVSQLEEAFLRTMCLVWIQVAACLQASSLLVSLPFVRRYIVKVTISFYGAKHNNACKTSAMFEINKYLGKWCQLACYPSWYSPPTSYNTTAYYAMEERGTVSVINSTTVAGVDHSSRGSATVIERGIMRVDFPDSERAFVSKAFGTRPTKTTADPNYIIHKVWTDEHGKYIYTVVTSPNKEQFYLLSRDRHPRKDDYDILMNYCGEHFDSNRIVQTPHY